MKSLVRSVSGCCLALAYTLTAAGCTESVDELPRESVWGKVTLDGEPLAKGAIRFRTATQGATTALEVGELIRDGQYEIPKGSGPVPGKYAVTITEEVERPANAGDPFGSRAGMKKSRIPAKYAKPMALTAEIKQGQADALDFALTTK
jgi:hypothetical protein